MRVDPYEGTKGRSSRGPLEVRYIFEVGGDLASKGTCGHDVVVGGMRHELKKLRPCASQFSTERSTFNAGDSGAEAVADLLYVCETVARHSVAWFEERRNMLKAGSVDWWVVAKRVVKSLSRGEFPLKTLGDMTNLIRFASSDVDTDEMCQLERLAHETFRDAGKFRDLLKQQTRASRSFPNCDALVLVDERLGYAQLQRHEFDTHLEFVRVSKNLPSFRLVELDRPA